MPTFGEVLCELREDVGFTQKQLAIKLHLAPTTISSYETGKIVPPPDKLIAIADFFGVTTDYLLGRSPYNINPAIFNEKLYQSITVGDFIENLKILSSKQKQAAATIIDDMKFRAEYRARAKLDNSN